MALEEEARVCLFSALLGLSVVLLANFGISDISLASYIIYYGKYLLAIVIINVVTALVYKGYAYQIALRSSMLGAAMGLGIILTFSTSTMRLFGWYLTGLSFFHWSEYFTMAVVNRPNLMLESFLLDHSKEYHIAAAASVVEFVGEWYFFPALKSPSCISVIGLLMVVGGEVLRKGAMITARTNFNHYVQHVKHEGHELVTCGVYNWMRHPSYVGWFYWSIGTQVMLCNPICLIGYCYASWSFFKQRIEHEEFTLLSFFGDDYVAYQKRVGTGIPFIEGYRLPL